MRAVSGDPPGTLRSVRKRAKLPGSFFDAETRRKTERAAEEFFLFSSAGLNASPLCVSAFEGRIQY